MSYKIVYSSTELPERFVTKDSALGFALAYLPDNVDFEIALEETLFSGLDNAPSAVVISLCDFRKTKLLKAQGA